MTSSEAVECLVAYSQAFIGAPYLYGGNGPHFDCSAFVNEIFTATFPGWPYGDKSAQGIYELLSGIPGCSMTDEPGAGDIAIYGSYDGMFCHHIALVVYGGYIIEAGGGDNKTLSLTDANRRGAFVRLRPLSFRTRDLVGFIRPNYEYLNKEGVWQN